MEASTARFRKWVLSLFPEITQLRTALLRIEQKIDLLETFSHGARATYVGNNRVLMKAVVAGANIAFFVEANDKLLSPWFIVTGQYDTPLTNYLVSTLRPDSHCVDIGANFGYFTCLMARFCPNGKIIGIEADRSISEIARDNIHINGFHNIATIIHAAASNGTEELTFYRRNLRSGNTSIVRYSEEFTTSLGEKPSQAFRVRGLCVDDLLPQMKGRIDVMKIDVEGAEPLVVEGAHRAIAANPNIRIVLEWSPAQMQAAGFDIQGFCSSLNRMELEPFEVDEKGYLSPLTFQELSKLPYRDGIVLMKRHKAQTN